MRKTNNAIILVNGTSSSGKSTLCGALQDQFDIPFWHFSSDHLIGAEMHPKLKFDNGTYNWSEIRPNFFDAFHRSISAFADAGINLIVEHIIEERAWAHQLAELLSVHDVFVVATRCPVVELEKREISRGDRQIGEAQFHMKTYEFSVSDLEIDTTRPINECCTEIIDEWRKRKYPCEFSSKWKSI